MFYVGHSEVVKQCRAKNPQTAVLNKFCRSQSEQVSLIRFKKDSGLLELHTARYPEPEDLFKSRTSCLRGSTNEA